MESEKKLTREELLVWLRKIPSTPGDEEDWHVLADAALVAYIDDSEVTAAYEAIGKWYA